MTTLLNIEIRFEQDVVISRQRARQIAQGLGFDSQDQTRIATAVSEIARNAFQYAKLGKVEFRMEGESPQMLLISITDKGTGIANLNVILEGNYKSPTGMGLGIIGSKRLMDRFEIESSPSGTKVVMGKTLPKRAAKLTNNLSIQIADKLAMQPPYNPFAEIQQQNQELIRTLEELRKRQDELTELNGELEATNRGVVALYAELDEKAEFLERANELKTHFLSNMSHEFRTPLNSIMSLSGMLIDRMDGELTTEQEKQVMFIRKSAEGLLELVNDLLDLAKVEAGKIVVHPKEFEVSDLFATLRGMLRPLLSHNSSTSLIFEEPVDIPILYTDEGKVAQILRNFISNALKYTEQGEIRIKADKLDNNVVFSVADTGIGIAPKDRERIFEEFTQVDSLIQKRFKGTGLGLPLSRKLAELLGGDVSLFSEMGAGSTFFATIPIVYGDETARVSVPEISWELDPLQLPILVIEDNAETIFTYEKYLEKSIYQIVSARSLKEAKHALEKFKPKAVLLDVLLEQESTWSFLSEMKQNPATQDIPILVATVIDNEKKSLALGADAFLIKPVDRLLLLKKINTLVRGDIPPKLLIVDDQLVSRYLLKELLANAGFTIIEATDGRSGIELALLENPACIFLDLVMPEMNGLEVLEHLKSNTATRYIPVIINTSELLSEEKIRNIGNRAVAILSKESLSSQQASAILSEALMKAGLVL